MTKNDYYTPQPAVLISTSRSGSTYLLNCLDSHPEIGCERAEPLNPISVWAELKVRRHLLMRVLWQRPGYKVSMFKLSYRQLKWVGTEILKEVKPKIIHCHRRNVLRVVVSSAINTAAVAGKVEHPTHAFETPEPVKITLDPDEVLRQCRKYKAYTKQVTRRLRKLDLPIMMLTYEKMMGGHREAFGLNGDIADQLCNFLEVKSLPMYSSTRRINPQPLSEIVSNWGRVKAALESSRFARYADGE